MPAIESINGINKRLRILIERKFGFEGKFVLLEEASGINRNRWKRFFYGAHDNSSEFVNFWIHTFPDSAIWLETGMDSMLNDGFPFLNHPPRRWDTQTVGDRLCWVIEEWASPRGYSLFQYLERRSCFEVCAEAWKELFLRTSEPTDEMIKLACIARPMFAEWVISGKATQTSSVDPTQQESVRAWKITRRFSVKARFSW